MGEIVWHKGLDDSGLSYGSTQPKAPSMASGGPIESFGGCDEGHSFGTSTGNDSVPRGNVIDSPTDK